MPSAVWKGSLSFGLVNIPVELHAATSDHTMRFHQLEAGTADRIRYKRVNERTGKEVDYGDIVRGYDLGGGEYVVLSPEELEAAAPERSRRIEIQGFVDAAEIDPIFYRGAYYLAPSVDGSPRAYALLRRAMGDASKVAIAMFVMRNKEYLVAVRPRSDVLVLETMYFADEIRDPAALIPAVPGDEAFTERELSTARLLLESMARPWVPEEYRDTYRERLEQLVERKRQGEVIVAEPAGEELAPVTNLMEALTASIERARSERSGRPRKQRSSQRSPTPKAAPGAPRGASTERRSHKGADKGDAQRRRPGGSKRAGARRRAS